MRLPHFVAVSAVLLSTSLFSTFAQASALPDCDSAGVLSRVNRTITTAEYNVVKSGDPVNRIERVRQSKLSEHGPSLYAKRYCRATGYTKRGHSKTIYYLIEAKAGFAGYGFSYAVEACVSGRDPWKVHGAYCSSVR
ncbi:hypothetical protein SAMN04515647_1744 [Cohaesibacter sp. ES.047]|uniref:hypothetical protein n=1 Tax=Cohaesibacter sp. ES.047 TaxID=1798205 RepID=UPI000BC0BE68|nr:hypothetical protein [Cohaesibacter sp. ES.047]SNY91516.1 hypothetical protein SAMN04515647_1744 [Cohaesibacter sp. ES.047]